jgi:hypothetical protein
VVTAWVLISVTALIAMLGYAFAYAPRFIGQGWRALVLQTYTISAGLNHHDVIVALNAGINALLLVLPLLGITFSYLLLCRGLGTSVARHSRRDLTLAPAREDKLAPS